MNIDRGWDGYYIEIEGKTILASRDSKQHKWIFKNGTSYNAKSFFTISEKKGEAILDFLKELSTCRQSKKTSKAAVTEDTFDEDQDEDTFDFPRNSKEISGAAVNENILDMGVNHDSPLQS